MGWGKSNSNSGTHSLAIDNDHIFTDETERDDYFSLNPADLSNETYCVVGGILYKYNGSSWADVSVVIKGADGRDGDAVGEDVTNKLDARILTLEAVDHEHSNKSILNSVTAAFTSEYEAKLANLTDRFKGVFADAVARDATLAAPVNGDYCKQTDTNSFWFYGSGAWIDTGSSSTGDMISSLYDPQGVADDVFNRENHTGLQAKSTVENLERDLDDINAKIASYPIGELFTLGVLEWNVQNVTEDISITTRGFKYSNPTLSDIEFVDTTTSLDYNGVTIENYLPTLETGQFCELIFVNAHGTERDNREFATHTMTTTGGSGSIRVFSGDNGIWSSNDQGLDEQIVYVEIKCIIS